MTTKKLMQAAAGNAGGEKVYVEDVFSTHLYTGTGSDLAINNGLDLSGEGGLVWVKSRATRSHAFYDTVRGTNSLIASNNTNGAATVGQYITYNNNGFTLTSQNNDQYSGEEYCSWSFRKKEGFFTALQYSGSGSSQNISHDLNSVPSMIIVKMISSDGYKWRVWHKSLGNSKALCLNDNSAESDDGGGGGGWWNNTAPTSSVFSVGTYGQTNNNGSTFIAYLFGEEASFGSGGDEAIVKCGSYTGNSSTPGPQVDCGFEPQLVLIKRTSATAEWQILDNMRGAVTGGSDAVLHPDTNDAEYEQDIIEFNATGFQPLGGSSNTNVGDYIFIAIRRGPMKEPSAGTDVLDIRTSTSAGSPAFLWNSLPFPPDWAGYRAPTDNGTAFPNSARLIQGKSLATRNTDAAQTSSNMMFDAQDAWFAWGSSGLSGYYSYAWRRYPKVFDVVVYEGNGSNSPYRTITHNLTVAPELVIIKNIDSNSTYWGTGFNTGNSDVDGRIVYLQLSGAYNGDGLTASATTVTLDGGFGGTSQTNANGDKHIMLLFSSLANVSKVGAYVGTGNDLNVTDLGAAARFVLIKRTDSSGDWFVFDSAMGGIVSGNDQYFRMNVAAAPVTGTDYIDPHSSGFTITSSAPADLNASGGKYLYLAFA